MVTGSDDMSALLAAALVGGAGGRTKSTHSRVEKLTRLTGGASMETWAFDWYWGDCCKRLILRRAPGGMGATQIEIEQPMEVSLSTEAQLLTLAGRHGVNVPEVILLLAPNASLGAGYIMTREGGEALPQRLLADDKYAPAREQMAYQCGATLGRIHQIPTAELPLELRNISLDAQFDRLQIMLDQYGNCSPVHQLGLNWLRQNQPRDSRRSLVHGDFRNGNLLVDEQGLVAVLDWELAHIGNPVEDLGYFCGNVWRFGNYDKPAGGFGSYQQLLEGYRSVTSYAPELAEIYYWEAYCALNWGLICLHMVDMYRTGKDRSLERAAIGRRVSESEIDLLLLLSDKLHL